MIATDCNPFSPSELVMESFKAVLTFESVDEILCFQMKPLQKLFYMVLFIEYVVLVN